MIARLVRHAAWPLLFALALAGCKAEQPPPRETIKPALWQVTGKLGERAWLFGTIHALPERVAWRSARIEAAMAGADELVLEIANVADQEAIDAAFARLARSPNQPPLLERVPAEIRSKLARLLEENDVESEQFSIVETWAAALILAKEVAPKSKAEFGIDREIHAAFEGRKIGELEGLRRQFAVFDRLPEADQRDFLAGIVAELTAPDTGADPLAKAWTEGDMALLAREAQTGFLADPELREALLVRRNRDWAQRVQDRLRRGGRPFVAVGAAHMAGPEGLPELLKAMGYTVTRVQ